ncbi:hypothetical protein GRI89_09090 [Altererythrobacter salegens]|uniref:Uncharacterized protein n=1 Tax=Croceibacterium salegens TaxID=1737568 RepID=A0A6I4SV11_9SPHN|nr:hypothetical protein [Croceibacterium salegens]MXO59693.1 hypothetical protein [Croceibacterium salegens]
MVEGLQGPDYAPECAPMFASRKEVHRIGEPRTALMDATNPTYCERWIWPRMNFDILKFAQIDCLVDPRDGSALVIDPAKIVPLNRKMLRELRARARG